ncbi:MAG: hypothetical protein R3Y59_10485 [bacterium]
MNTIKKYTFEELLNISTEEFNEWKGLTLNILKKDGTEFTGVLLNLQLASLSNPPQLVCGFIFTDDTSINLQSIKTVCLYE